MAACGRGNFSPASSLSGLSIHLLGRCSLVRRDVNIKFQISDFRFGISDFTSNLSDCRFSEVPEGRHTTAHRAGDGKTRSTEKQAPAGKAKCNRSREINPLPNAVSSLHAPALGSPCEESRELFALAPNEPEKLHGPQLVHVTAEKRFEAPANVRAGPRTQAVILRRDPVVAERSEHQCDEFIAFRPTRRRE